MEPLKRRSRNRLGRLVWKNVRRQRSGNSAAARQLSGGLSGGGFMYQVRRVVGVDTLEYREAAVMGAASSVAGKYLTPEIYIEVNQSLNEAGNASMIAEYELTRDISVETSTGPKMRPGIGVNWKTDY